MDRVGDGKRRQFEVQFPYYQDWTISISMLRLRVTGRGSERTFLDLLNAQHIVQGVTHERGGIFHQAQRFQVTTIQAVAVFQDLDADGQRVQRTA